jgi:hypothetical protein
LKDNEDLWLFFLSSTNCLATSKSSIRSPGNEVRLQYLYPPAESQFTLTVPTCPRGELEEYKKEEDARGGSSRRCRTDIFCNSHTNRFTSIQEILTDTLHQTNLDLFG